MDMPPFNNQPASNDNESKDWFSAINAGSPLPPPPQQSNGPSLKRRLLIGISGVLVVLGLTAGILTALGVDLFSTAPACLTKDDYTRLTGKQPDDSLSPQSFYTTSFDFANGTADYTGSSRADAEAQAKKIGEFYVKNAESRSIVITISSDAVGSDTVTAATSRIDALKSLLLKNGVTESAVQTIKPTAVDTSGELSADSAELSSAKAYINVASIAACKK